MELGSIKNINKKILWVPLIAIGIFLLWLVVLGVKILFFTEDLTAYPFGRLILYFIFVPVVLVIIPIMWFLIMPKKQKGEESKKQIPENLPQ